MYEEAYYEVAGELREVERDRDRLQEENTKLHKEVEKAKAIRNEVEFQKGQLQSELIKQKAETEKWNSRAAQLNKHAKKAEAEVLNSEKRNDAWKREVERLSQVQFRRFNDEECWIYQGDGEDYPESLVCPVVISAEQLREFLKAVSERDELKKESLAFHSIAGQSLTFHKDSDPMYVSGFTNAIRLFEDIYLGEPHHELKRRDIEQQIKALIDVRRKCHPYAHQTIDDDIEQLRKEV